MAEKENLDIPMIATAGIVSVVLTIAAVIGVQTLYYSYAAAETERKVTALPTTDANSKLAEQDAKLAQYGWVDREQGQVVIPIERAMSLMVKDYSSNATTDLRSGMNIDISDTASVKTSETKEVTR